MLENRHGPTPSRALCRCALSCHQPGYNQRQKIYKDDPDYQRFEALLGEVVTRHSLNLYAYVLMPNHFHLLVEVGRVPLSKAMQVLLYRYTRRYNQRYRKSHLFQGGEISGTRSEHDIVGYAPVFAKDDDTIIK